MVRKIKIVLVNYGIFATIKTGLVICGIFAMITIAGCSSKPTHTNDTAPISHTEDAITVYPDVLYEFEVETGTRVKGYGEFKDDGLFYITEQNGNKWDGVDIDNVYVIESGKGK